ncbi:MAG: nitroreductase family deazaflavin-dependent oxidoreductase [Chloroflexota bacterium]
MTDAGVDRGLGRAPEPPMDPGPDPMGAELASWGRVLLLETTGRRSGLSRVTPVGFVEDPDGSLRIAAGSPETAWARNLLAEPRCRVSIGGAVRRCRAEALDAAAAHEAVVALILRYGTPAEGLGRGPVFRLVPAVLEGA